MNVTTFLTTLAIMVGKYFPEEMDPSLKPKDSADCISCRKQIYDFIIVGAGSAGSVLANRLSANKKWKILLLEAGGDENYLTDIPALSSILYGTEYDWNFTTVKQDHACYNTNGICRYPAGHVMGGTSTINGMDYVRGNQHDYDEWEEMGNPGWKFTEVFPYFLKAENMTIPSLASSIYHSTKGPLYVGYARYHTRITQDIINSALEQDRLQDIDYNGRSQIGISDLQFTMKGATRCSTSKAYLDPIRDRKNLIIFKNTKAIKILINPKTKKADGLQCITNNKTYNVYARKEVILSAGVMNTPKLLMLSGIGPKEDLDKLNIPVIADLPVGKNFQDHSGVSLYFSVNKTALNCCTEYTNETILEYAKYKKGALTSPFQQVLAFLNLLNTTTSVSDVTVILGIIGQQFSNQTDPRIFAYVGNISPKSRGTIKLNTDNHQSQPLIDPNYFQNLTDMDAVRRGIRHVVNFMNATSMNKYSPKWITTSADPYCKQFPYMSDDYLNCFIRYTTTASYHGVGTAKMGPYGDQTSVVSSKLRVHNVKNLRVVDASIMPRITRGNTNAPVIMIAEKAADMILCSYDSCSS